MGSRVAGWGAALPERVLTNAELERTLDTTDAWIVERTGIRERRLGSTTAELATTAARAAIERAGISPGEVGHLLLATATPARLAPATAVEVHHRLGLGGGALDLNAVCAGFVYALILAAPLAESAPVLVVGADTLARHADPADRAVVPLFGEGAGALLLVPAPGPGLLLAADAGTDSSARDLFVLEHGGAIEMRGPEIFRRALRATAESIALTLRAAALSPDEVDLVVPHQANGRLIDALVERAGLPAERVARTLEATGNVSSGSVPLALAAAADAGQLDEGDTVLLTGFGAGLTWATALVRW